MAKRKSSTTAAMVAAPNIGAKYRHQILYLKAVHTYLNNPAERAKKVKYCKQEKFNGVIMYGVDGIISAQSYWPGLRAFILELQAAGVKYIGLAYSNDNVVTFLNNFQDATSSVSNFSFGISEIEPWVSTSGISWDEYIDRIASFRAWASIETDRVYAWTYQGWAQKPTGTNRDSNVKRTIQSVDNVCLHIYTYPKPNPSYGVDRWKWYGQQALLMGFTATRKLPVFPIYSAEIEFSQEGFKTKAPVDFYTEFITYMDGLTFPGKECLAYNLGFIVFKDTDLMVARPLKP